MLAAVFVGIVLLTRVGVGGGSYTCLLASFIWLISPLAWLAPLQMTINRHWVSCLGAWLGIHLRWPSWKPLL